MLNVVLSASLALSQMPASVVLPEQLAGHDVRAVLQATATHFVAESTAFEGQVLLIGDVELGVLRAVRLAPGQVLSWAFSRGSVDGVWLEVVQLDVQPWPATGALRLTDVQSSEGGALWVEQTGGHALAWTLERARLVLQAPLAGDAQRGARGTFHVPGTPPGDARDKQQPPIIKDKPLPPV